MRPDRWAVWIAGAAAPTEESFGGCIDVLGEEVRSLAKGLELFAAAQPIDDYSLATEVRGLRRAMDDAGVERAHLVGFSGGGGVALAFALEHPERVASLVLDEHVIGHRFGVADEDRFWADVDDALEREGLDATLRVVAATNAPDADPPDFGDPPPAWLASRIERTPRLVRAVRDHAVSAADLAGVDCPVHLTYGTRTRTTFKGWCEAVARSVPRGTVEAYEGCDHFRPAHQLRPDRFVAALLAHWDRA